jgi:lipopolysaccharide/colanic/teichoic acid biosynthesis glycosyltransferase
LSGSSSSLSTGSPTQAAGAPYRPLYAFCKRTFDLTSALVGIVLVSPVLLLAAILVKLSSAGPVFYRQRRMGRNFVPFDILKFRTMVVDADKRGGQITAGADPRITRVGHWLRKTKVDELPQLFNVLVGQMSLVGPRPEVPKYVEMYREQFAYVLSVRPGVTDPASVKYRDEATLLGASPDPEREYVERVLPDKLAIARDYIARATFGSDLAVIVRTVVRVAS